MTDDDMMPPPEVIEAFAKDCRCPPCCADMPCAGAMAGGICDDRRCRCDDDIDDGYDPNGCHGCGGSCQTACR